GQKKWRPPSGSRQAESIERRPQLKQHRSGARSTGLTSCKRPPRDGCGRDGADFAALFCHLWCCFAYGSRGYEAGWCYWAEKCALTWLDSEGAASEPRHAAVVK